MNSFLEFWGYLTNSQNSGFYFFIIFLIMLTLIFTWALVRKLKRRSIFHNNMQPSYLEISRINKKKRYKIGDR